MRLLTLSGSASALALVLVLAACSSSEEASAVDPTATPNGTDPTGGADPAKPADAPLAARPVCSLVALDATFAKGCSGSVTSSKGAFCAIGTPGASACGEGACVYQSDDASYGFTCSAACQVGGTAGCPVGFECRAETACGTGGGAYCAKKQLGCAKVNGVSGTSTFFEGTSGEVLAITRGTGDGLTLRLVTGTTSQVLATWNDVYDQIAGLARAGSHIVATTTGGYEIDLAGKTAQVGKSKKPRSATSALGVTKGGEIIAIDQESTQNATFGARVRREADGSWTDLGPTRQRLQNVRALQTGFVARCGETLCGSVDGETFTNQPMPDGVAFPTDNTTTLSLAGASPDDFYLTDGTRLFHWAVRSGKGAWVQEGPVGAPKTGTSQFQARVSAFGSGDVVFVAFEDTKPVPYVVSGGCWRAAPGQYNLDRTQVAAKAFRWTSTDGSVCALPID